MGQSEHAEKDSWQRVASTCDTRTMTTRSWCPLALILLGCFPACGSGDESSGNASDAGTPGAGGTGGSTGGTGGTQAGGGEAGQAGTGGLAGAAGVAGSGGDAGATGGASGSGGAAGTAGAAGTGQPLPWLAGVNLSCAEFGESHLPGVYGTDYTYPTHDEVDYFVGKGMNVFRLPFRWERLQPTLDTEFDAVELGRLDEFVTYASGKGAWVILDPHNYARYHGNVIGAGSVSHDSFADFWRRLAERYANEPKVIFGLMNEPNSMQTELWLTSANAAIAAIRTAGAENLVLVPGNGWSGAHSWLSSYYGTPNGDVMLGVVDPSANFAFEMHQYLDSDSSGTSEGCVSATIGSERMQAATAWLAQHGYKGLLGEFGGGRNTTCYEALDDLLTYLEDNDDVWLGWTYWAAGPWWGDYMFSLEPAGGQDRPQMDVLSQHL